MIKPIKELIVVRPDIQQDKTASGLYIPDEAKDKMQTGVVIDVGSEVKEIKSKDRIAFGKYSGSEVEIKGVKYLIFKEDDVLGVIS